MNIPTVIPNDLSREEMRQFILNHTEETKMNLNVNNLGRLEFVIEELADMTGDNVESILRKLVQGGVVTQEEATEIYSYNFI